MEAKTKKKIFSPFFVLFLLAFAIALYFLLFPGPPESWSAMTVMFFVIWGGIILIIDLVLKFVVLNQKRLLLIELIIIIPVIAILIIDPAFLYKLIFN